jgi:hypothetical protein
MPYTHTQSYEDKWTHRMDGTEIIIIIIKKNSMVLVRERTIPTERPPLVGEISATHMLTGLIWLWTGTGGEFL